MRIAIRRAFLILLVISIVVPLIFTGCEKTEPPDDTTSSDPIFTITKDNLVNYTIVVSGNCSDFVYDLALQLQSRIETVTGTKLEIKKDFIVKESDVFSESEYEILLGNVNRIDAEELHSGVRQKDSGYAMIDKKIVIIGYTDVAIEYSLTLFNYDILNDASSKDVLMTSGISKIVNGDYTYKALTVNGTDISKYKIVYPKTSTIDEKNTASNISKYIAIKTGYILECYSDSSDRSEYEIQVGNTNRITDEMLLHRNQSEFSDDKYYISPTDNGLWVSGNTSSAINSAYYKLFQMIEVNNNMASLNITSAQTLNIGSLPISIMTYNIYHTFSSSRNPDYVLQSIEEQSTNIFGCNEASEKWMTLLLPKFSGTYTCVKGKNSITGDSGDYCPIFYRTDKFNLVESGSKWLSDTPDKMSKYDESHTYRNFTYAVLKDKITGIEFMYVQVHFENNTDGLNSALARKKQSAVLKDFTDTYAFLPIIIGGDCNTTLLSDLSPLLINTRFTNSMSIASEKKESGTWVGSTFTDITGGVLDYIFVTNSCVSVQKYEAVNNKIDGKYPSDHIPVRINAKIYQ